MNSRADKIGNRIQPQTPGQRFGGPESDFLSTVQTCSSPSAMTTSAERLSPTRAQIALTPTEAQRCEYRQRPDSPVVVRQRWKKLLFPHWKIDPTGVQATLPRGLYVDTFVGMAYLGIVPFAMERVRPRGFLPSRGCRGFSNSKFALTSTMRGDGSGSGSTRSTAVGLSRSLSRVAFSICPTSALAWSPPFAKGKSTPNVSATTKTPWSVVTFGSLGKSPRLSLRAHSISSSLSGICFLQLTRRPNFIPDACTIHRIA